MAEHPEESLQETEREELPSGTEDPQAEGGVSPAAEEVTPEASLEQSLRKEVEEWRDKFLRKAAELENFRKRAQQDFASISETVRQGLILEILPVLDDFDRLLSSGQSNDVENLHEGARLIRDKLSNVLAAFGVERIEAEGKPFDHDEHEAILTIETADHPPSVVVSVVRPGYKMNGKVIRHAQVAVSKEPEESAPSSDD